MAIEQSPQGLAALTVGKPKILEERVQQSGQNPQTGLPNDLVSALALSINMTKANAAERDSALQQLQQAAGPSGQMPTVVQGLQEQAKQKMAQMQQQAMAQQQAMDQQAPVADGTPQPVAQAQGIDQLPAEFNMAGGGIVSFNGEDSSVPKKDKEEEESELSKYAVVPELAATSAIPAYLYRQAQDLAVRMGTSVGEVLKTLVGDTAAAVRSGAGHVANATKAGAGHVAKTATTGGAAPAAGILALGVPFTQFSADVVRSASPEQRAGFYENPMVGAMGGDAALAAAIMNESKPAQAARAAAPAEEKKPQVVTQTVPTRQGPGDMFVPRRPLPTDKKVDPEMAQIDRMLASLTSSGGRSAGGGNAGLPAAIAALTSQQRLSPEQIEAKAQVEEANTRARYAQLAPDTSTYDRLMAEYDAQRKSLNPKEGWEALMERMGDIAAGGRGRTWYEAGAQGAAAGEQRRKENAAKQFEFTKQMLETEQKKKETARLFQLETEKAGKEAFDKSYTHNFNILKEQGMDARQASANATQLATTSMQVAETARGHTLQAQNELMRLRLTEQRSNRDDANLQLKSLAETAKELGALVKDPVFAQSPEGQRSIKMIQTISAEIAKRGGVDLGQVGFSSAPTANVRPALK